MKGGSTALKLSEIDHKFFRKSALQILPIVSTVSHCVCVCVCAHKQSLNYKIYK